MSNRKTRTFTLPSLENLLISLGTITALTYYNRLSNPLITQVSRGTMTPRPQEVPSSDLVYIEHPAGGEGYFGTPEERELIENIPTLEQLLADPTLQTPFNMRNFIPPVPQAVLDAEEFGLLDILED